MLSFQLIHPVDSTAKELTIQKNESVETIVQTSVKMGKSSMSSKE